MRAIEAGGKEVPALENKPSVPRDLQRAWEYFLTLHARRQVGWDGPLPISTSDIFALLKLEQISPDSWQWLFRHILNLDGVFLEWVREQKDSRPRKGKG